MIDKTKLYIITLKLSESYKIIYKIIRATFLKLSSLTKNHSDVFQYFLSATSLVYSVWRRTRLCV